MQHSSSHSAFQIMDLTCVSEDVAVSHTDDYMTFWQRIPEPAETPSVRWAFLGYTCNLR